MGIQSLEVSAPVLHLLLLLSLHGSAQTVGYGPNADGVGGQGSVGQQTAEHSATLAISAEESEDSDDDRPEAASDTRFVLGPSDAARVPEASPGSAVVRGDAVAMHAGRGPPAA